jgi:hypothetical protein
VRNASFFVWSLISVNSTLNVIWWKRTYNKEKHEALAVASKQKGLEVNADKTKYLVMSRNQNAGQNHNVKSDNKSFERVQHFKNLGTAPTNQSFIHEEIKADRSQAMLPIIRCRNFVFQFAIHKYKD